MFWTAIWNTSYFVLLTVAPGTAVALAIALMVSRLNGWLQSLILAMFFLPYVLAGHRRLSLWNWLTNVQYGVLEFIIAPLAGHPHQCLADHSLVHALRRAHYDLVDERLSILLFLAGLRNIPARTL